MPTFVPRLLASKAGIIRELKAGSRRSDRSLPLTLSYGQERLWFVDTLEPGQRCIQHLEPRDDCWDEVSEGALLRAVDALVVKHESLRTTFEIVDGRAGAADPRTAPENFTRRRT